MKSKWTQRLLAAFFFLCACAVFPLAIAQDYREVEPREPPTLTLVVSLEQQLAQLYIGGKAAGSARKVSTASSKNTDCTSGVCETPAGTFVVTRTNRHAYSAKWHVPMPNAVFFGKFINGKPFDDGDAVHAATVDELSELGHVASHGCIRFAPEDASDFFDRVQQHRRGDRWPGVTVVVLRGKLEAPHEFPVASGALKI